MTSILFWISALPLAQSQWIKKTIYYSSFRSLGTDVLCFLLAHLPTQLMWSSVSQLHNTEHANFETLSVHYPTYQFAYLSWNQVFCVTIQWGAEIEVVHSCTRCITMQCCARTWRYINCLFVLWDWDTVSVSCSPHIGQSYQFAVSFLFYFP